MKRTIILVSLLAAILGCQKEQNRMTNEISFELSKPASKATSTSFETGDEVLLYAVEYLGEEAQELQIADNYINNEKLTFDGASWSAGSTLYWSDKPCDFYALYPYQNISSVDEWIFSIQLDQDTADGYQASDLMFAKASSVVRADEKVALQFKHLMSKCVVTVEKGENFEGEIPDDIVTHIYNTTTSAILNFANGSLQRDPQGGRKTITMKKVSSGRFEAVVVPQNIERRTPLIEVTMGGIAYLLEYSLSFKPGYVHTINLILNTSPDQEKIEISISTELDGMD